MSEPDAPRPAAPALVPELLVRDRAVSLEFWCGVCGFEVLYERPEEGFAFLSLGTANVMLEQIGVGRNWITAPLEHPFGRGINLQIDVPGLAPILDGLRRRAHPLVLAPETRWYRVSDREEVGQRQFVVADPDGYLLRFQEALGRRARDPRDAAP